MSLISFIRDLQEIPERIPGPGAIFYNATAARLLKKPEYELAHIIVKKISTGTVVDLGSGTGYLSIEIAKNAPALTLCGIDLSKKMIDISRGHARGIPNVCFELANATTLPFENDSVDFIVSTGSLHHWRHPAKVFDECYRILKPGGEGWIFDGYPDFPRGKAEQFKAKYGTLHSRMLSNVLKFHGFTDVEYHTRIKHALDQSKFKNCYQMEPVDVWMRISIQKSKSI
jgi:ubiquinone/menaquinone biosynthesis C-methylase UbiE